MSNFSKNIIKTAEVCAIFAAKLQIFISYFGVFLNILHFIILCNKKLRYQSVNVLLIGIAISDFLFLIFYFDGGTRDFLQAGVPYECRPPKSLLLVYWTQILQAFRDIFQRVSAYLGMFLALLRYLVMKYGTIRKTFLSLIDCWKLFVLLILISSLITCFLNLKLSIVPSTKWRPPSSCTMYPANSTFPGYGTIQTDFYKLLPPISYIYFNDNNLFFGRNSMGYC
ncbi:G-protein coupled receptors family 1 profile domain-containing protein [Caenorhabditis elegans]|uniref:G-protein coupled receptors family 1 profile domain-containing protein n=1 Tax=Caenorhabditis elegans TaxID=6239 RepID=A5JYW5_CAEEL|nr:G-protein coupled receptors family 1 profile domain-containing protein [Caenorhabditis elegans]CAN86579.1 G-protein coupled receptors family 1 profile domain-containing protein [Caenorhabditis elegans]|eukprot:NP_001122861.1 Uncharacterized protein CELE_C25F9.13 [Caenorhabditis elegans]